MANPLAEDRFLTVVYRNGRYLPSSCYEVHRQQTGVSLFIDRAEVADGDVVAIEFRRFWNDLAWVTETCGEDADELVFSFPSGDLGTVYNYDDVDSTGDYLVFTRATGDRHFSLVPRSECGVRRSATSEGEMVATVSRPVSAGTEVAVVNNSAAWAAEVVTETWEDTFELVTHPGAGPNHIDTFHLSAKSERYPLPVERESELCVWVKEPGPDSSSFKLVPGHDFSIAEPAPGSEYGRRLVLGRKAAPGSTVMIAKVEPDSWFRVDHFEEETGTLDGVFELQGQDVPLDVSYLDVTLNNKHHLKNASLSSGSYRGGLENIADGAFRVVESDTNNLFLVRARVLKNAAIKEIVSKWSEGGYKSELESFIHMLHV
jgi:hypothetical protein